jgi:hypothetical protein
VNFLSHPRNHLPDFVGRSFNQSVMGNRAAHDFPLLVIQLDFEFGRSPGRLRKLRLELLQPILHDRSLKKRASLNHHNSRIFPKNADYRY